MWINQKNLHKMNPDETTINDYEERLSHLRNLASSQNIVNADLQGKLLKANETIDALRKEVTELISKNYEQSKIIAELYKKEKEDG